MPRTHPRPVVTEFADRAPAELSPIFNEMCAAGGGLSIPLERLLKASLLIAPCPVRGERAFREQWIATSYTAGFWIWVCGTVNRRHVQLVFSRVTQFTLGQ